MKILFLVRSNFYKLSGGDKIQVEKTKLELEKLGHEVTISTKLTSMNNYDVVHLYNMQIKPQALMVYMLSAQKLGIPVALSTIYWNPTRWRAYQASLKTVNAGSKRKLPSYPFSGLPLWQVPAAVIRYKQLRTWLALYLKHPGSGEASDYVKRFLVANADIILPNGESEGELVQKDYGRAKACQFVPNGVDEEFKNPKPEDFTKKYKLADFVLSVGRVESRKNAVALATAAKELSLQLVFIGNNELEPEYCASVKAAASRDTIFINEMPHGELGSAYAAAKVHAQVSWFETPGLSSLEAAVAGCNIVSTSVGTTKEYFDKHAWYCEPDDYKSIVEALKNAVTAPKRGLLRAHLLARFNWKIVARETEKAYVQIVGQK